MNYLKHNFFKVYQKIIHKKTRVQLSFSNYRSTTTKYRIEFFLKVLKQYRSEWWVPKVGEKVSANE